VEANVLLLKKSWKRYKKTNDKNALFKAVIHAFRCNVFSRLTFYLLDQYLFALLLNFLVSCLELSSPFFVKMLIEFIQNKEEDTIVGILLVVFLVFT
jgi:ABC-type bacteriocin/lantibiotic exporter with double-glycine peptidase domain